MTRVIAGSGAGCSLQAWLYSGALTADSVDQCALGQSAGRAGTLPASLEGLVKGTRVLALWSSVAGGLPGAPRSPLPK